MSPVPPDVRALPLVIVVGATASGKSDLAVELALRLGGEVVNADAMQLYRGMDIGTAKITPGERRGVPHHLLDVLDVAEDASVSAYQDAALAEVAAIRERGALPIAVGGSGLYVRALADGLDFPATDVAVRERYERLAARVGPEALHDRLAQRDSDAAARIGARDVRRIVRALEVTEVTGKPFRAAMPERRYREPGTVQIGLARGRGDLRDRVAVRVDTMLAEGLVTETEGLMERGLRGGTTARRALGYAQVIRYLDGELTWSEMREQTITGTRRLVRKQDTWFHRDARIEWIDAAEPALVERALEVLARHGIHADRAG